MSFPELHSLTIYHFRFAPVNKLTEGKARLADSIRFESRADTPIDAASEKK